MTIAEADVSPPARLWRHFEHLNPPLPQWIEDAWIQKGRPSVAGGELAGPAGQALLWFVSNWYSARTPYRFGLPTELLAWLNAPETDLTPQIRHRPGLRGDVPCSAFKPVTRLMRFLWEQRGRAPLPDNAEGYYDLLAEFAFSILPASNAPAALLSGDIVSLLNAPAADDELPLTVGMLLYIKRTWPKEYRKLRGRGPDRILALSYRALEGLLERGDPRLIPVGVSGFWSQRPLPGQSVTAFEYVAVGPLSHFENDGSPLTEQADGKAIRNSFYAESVSANPCALLFSGPHGDLPAVATPEMRIADRAIVIYRDHVTTAGLSKAGASISTAVSGKGLPVFDVHFSLGRDNLNEEARQNRSLWMNARRKLHILSLNPEYLAECLYSNSGLFGRKDYIVGQFFWELSSLSRVHEPGIGIVDEIWTASRFLTGLYRTCTTKPVITMGLVVSGGEVQPLQPEQFGFPPDTFIFLCSFDAGSSVERKNPLGAIIAFQQAFPKGTERVGLIIKTRKLEHIQTEKDKIHWANAMARIRQDRRIQVIVRTMTDYELSALHRMCSCFVSLHRSEGFGYGPAEAMAQGRPAIVTNYSGVCDFCTRETAMLVDYDMVSVGEGEFPFLDPVRVYEWADPDLTQAAEYMRMLAEDREHAEKIGRAGKALMLKEYSAEAIGARYLARIERLGFGLSPDSGGSLKSDAA